MDITTLPSPAAVKEWRRIQIIEEILQEVMTLENNNQLAEALKLKEDLMKELLSRFLDDDERAAAATAGHHAVESSDDAASDQQLKDMVAATKTKEEKLAAKSKKKKPRKQESAGGFISQKLIAFRSIVALIFSLSFIHQIGGSEEQRLAPPAFPPLASRYLRERQREHLSDDDNAASPEAEFIMSPLPASIVAPPPIFAPAASTTSNQRRMKFDELRSVTTCLDTPNWKDSSGFGCDIYVEYDVFDVCTHAALMAGDMGPATENCCICRGKGFSLPPTPEFCSDTPNWKDKNGWKCEVYEKFELCSLGDAMAGDMGPATENCCSCGGAGVSLPLSPINSPTITISPTKSSDTPSTSPTSSPSSSPSISSISSNPPEFCLDTPNWKDSYGDGCDWYEKYIARGSGCLDTDQYAGDMGPATENCCYCKGAGVSLSPINSPNPSSSPSSSPTKSCFDKLNWKDGYGSGCEVYKVYDLCSSADAYAGDMGPATENCCYCGSVSTPSLNPSMSSAPSSEPSGRPSSSPSLNPSVSSAPSSEPSAQPSSKKSCFDKPNWKDGYGSGCEVYKVYDLCSLADAFAGDMGPATENCCYCGSVSTPSLNPSVSSAPSSEPSAQPSSASSLNPSVSSAPSSEPSGRPSSTPSMNPSVSSAPSSEPFAQPSSTKSCFDKPNWKDGYGSGCGVYKVYDLCSLADAFAGDMGPATENCCYCGSVSTPSLNPSMSSAPSSEPSAQPYLRLRR